jgi:D-tyrosyl-tRNA(Tyr) deacylase
MRALIQRVSRASVSVGGVLHNAIERGMVVFLGISNADSADAAAYLAQKCADLRIFEDQAGKMNLSIRETGGSALVVSQFTLYADTKRGNRPSFTEAAPPEIAEKLYGNFVGYLQEEIGEPNVRTGLFRAMMDVQLTNSGPVTIMIESKGHAS